MRRSWLSLVLCCLAGLLALEFVLRLFGWRSHPLYRTDPRYEYLTLPDQDVQYGAIHFITNALGLRSPAIGKKRGRRVLLIGDSVLNGGLQTTQDSLATTRAAGATGIELINLSAASWGPDNAMAFLRAHGTFDADGIIILFSSHDAYDRMTFTPIVGVHPSYPDHQPLLALSRAIDQWRYRYSEAHSTPRERGPFVNGWRALADTARTLGVPLVVLLHPEQGELTMGHYDDRGQRILDSLRAWDVPVVELLDSLEHRHYTDRIHLGNGGQHRLAEVLAAVLDTASNTFARAPTPAH